MGDHWETPAEILFHVLPLFDSDEEILDPFYSTGRVVDEWRELERTCINPRTDDAMDQKDWHKYKTIITNPPFSKLERIIPSLIRWQEDKEERLVAVLIPEAVIHKQWFQELAPPASVLLLRDRGFIDPKTGIKTETCPHENVWAVWCVGPAFFLV